MLDLRKRPATLKVSRLVQDFGYAEWSPSVAEAIEARLANVSLTSEPSLRVVDSGDVITITRSVRRPARAAAAPQTTVVDRGPARTVTAPLTPQPPVDTERIALLERELTDARSQIGRLRAELEKQQSASPAQVAAQADPDHQRVMIDDQRRAAQLIDALHETQTALAATMSDIQHCSQSLRLL